jgi:hypothetical protein
MKWFYDMKIGSRLIGAFIVVGIITAVVGVMGISNMGKIANLANSSYTNETVAIGYLADAHAALLEMARAEKNFLLATSQDERAKYRDKIAEFQSIVSDNLEKARPYPKPVAQFDTAPAKPPKANGHDTSAEGMAMAKAGVALRLNEKHDEADTEFERY